MVEFFEKTFYGNTIADWLVALLIIAASIVIAKIAYWIFGNILKKIADKTKSKLDDLIIDKIEEPIVLALVLGGLWYGAKYLIITSGIENFLDKIFYVAVTFDISWFIARLFDALIIEYLAPIVKRTKGNLDNQLLPIIRKTLKVVIWTIATVVGLNNAGYEVGAIVAGLGLGGLAFAMAAKDSVANIFGGITVFFDKPFKINDRVKIGGYDGKIREIGIRSTRLETLEGRIVTIPNKNFTDSFIENVSSEKRRKVKIILGLTYNTEEEKIKKTTEILNEIVDNNDDLEDDRVVVFNQFGAFSLDILFVYYIKAGKDNFTVQSNINFEILNKFKKENIDLAFPTQTIIKG